MSGIPIQFVQDGTAVTGEKHWPGGRGTFAAAGAFNSATLTLRWRLPGGVAWTDLVSLTAEGAQNFEIARGEIDLDVTGGPPTGHNVFAIPYEP